MPDSFLGPDKWRDDVITVVVCDDFALARRRLLVLLEDEDDVDVAAEAVDSEQCVALCAELGPDVVVIGMTVERAGGPATAAAVREAVPSAHVVMLVTAADDRRAVQAVEAGASGFVSRELLDAAPAIVRATAAGTAALPPAVARRIVDALTDDVRREIEVTDAELAVLASLAAGATYADAAAGIGVTDGVARALAANVLEKLYRRHRTASVLAAAGAGGPAD